MNKLSTRKCLSQDNQTHPRPVPMASLLLTVQAYLKRKGKCLESLIDYKRILFRLDLVARDTLNTHP
jgi:hypothetical protein